MTVHLQPHLDGKTLEVHVSGKLTKEDYERLVPDVEERIRQHGKIRLMLVTHDFHGWQAGALWEDIKFDAKHFNDIERLAIVGEKQWEKGMAIFCKPFTTAKVRFFEHGHEDEARQWTEAE